MAAAREQIELAGHVDVVAGHGGAGSKGHVHAECEELGVAAELEASRAQAMRHRRAAGDVGPRVAQVDEIARARPPGVGDNRRGIERVRIEKPLDLGATMLTPRRNGVVTRARSRDDQADLLVAAPGRRARDTACRWQPQARAAPPPRARAHLRACRWQ